MIETETEAPKTTPKTPTDKAELEHEAETRPERNEPETQPRQRSGKAVPT